MVDATAPAEETTNIAELNSSRQQDLGGENERAVPFPNNGEQQEGGEGSSLHQQQQHPEEEDDEKKKLPQHHNHHNSHHDLMPLYSHPKQRQRWGDRQLPPHKNWGDIFFDLFYVALAYNLGNLLRNDPSPRGLLYLIGCFAPVIGLWQIKLFYDARYYISGRDIFHEWYEVAALLALGTSVHHISTTSILSSPSSNDDMFAFCLSIVVGYVLAIGRWIEIVVSYKLNKPDLYPEAYIASRRESVWMIVVLIFYISAAVYSGVHFYSDGNNGNYGHHYSVGYPDYDNGTTSGDTTTDNNHRRHLAEGGSDYPSSSYYDDIPVYLLLGGSLASSSILAVLVLAKAPKFLERFRIQIDLTRATVPFNIDFCIHRYGEWTMLMLGESVLSLLIVDVSEGLDYYVTFFCGILSITLMQYLHFRSQPHDPDDHAMRRDNIAGFLFTQLYYVYSVALVVLGTTYKMFLYEFVYSDKKDEAGQAKNPILAVPFFSRLLAGGSSGALLLDTDDRKQRSAAFFSGSLAVVLFCLDIMILLHCGLKASMKRVGGSRSFRRFFGILLTITRIALIFFAATVFLYEHEPEQLAVIGLCTIVAELIIRGAGRYLFPCNNS